MNRDIYIFSFNEISREGLSYILRAEDFNVAGAFRDIAELADPDLVPECLALIDYPDPRDQVQAVERLSSLCPLAKIVVLAECFDMKSMIQCFHLGAQGYITKSMKSLPMITSLQL